MSYEQFVEGKLVKRYKGGFEVGEINPMAKPHQKLIIPHALKLGRYCVFADTGLGKTFMQVEIAHQVVLHTDEPVLIVAPLAVCAQTADIESKKFGYKVTQISSTDEVDGAGIYITNYEKLLDSKSKESKIDTSIFVGVCLDESSILKNATSKTRIVLTDKFADTRYKFAFSATPAPNDLTELCTQCEWLGVMAESEVRAEFFINDQCETSKWRLKGHCKTKFWEFVSTWACYLSNPSQFGIDGSEYMLPDINYHPVEVGAWDDLNNGELINAAAQGLKEQRAVRKKSLQERCQAAADIVNAYPSKQWLIWCETNDESALLTSLIDDATEVKGATKDKDKADYMIGFGRGDVRVLVTKPSIAGFGMNWQNCHSVVFVGLTHSFEKYYQAVRRVWRFGQTKNVDVFIISHVLEGAIVDSIKRKEIQAKQLADNLSKLMSGSLTQRIASQDYNPTVTMQIPAWLTTKPEDNKCLALL